MSHPFESPKPSVSAERATFLYYQTVFAAENYDEKDVQILVSVLNDDERIVLADHYRKYVALPCPSESRRSKNDRIVFAIASIIDKAALDSKRRKSLAPKPLFQNK